MIYIVYFRQAMSSSKDRARLESRGFTLAQSDHITCLLIFADFFFRDVEQVHKIKWTSKVKATRQS